MGIDWESILGTTGVGLQLAYDDAVGVAQPTGVSLPRDWQAGSPGFEPISTTPDWFCEA